MGTTGCGAYRLGLGVYALGRLAPAEADELSLHLDGCPPCRAELAELRDVADLLARSVQATGSVRPAGPVRRDDPRRRRGAGRGARSGAVRPGFSGACSAARGPGRSA
ncbi:anti-sigma factor family protein [Spirillospora albida]|uniref:anti-sigma factor family protein n=1 Tax=Spirillospora albida TaxID=58123 RepID=UPI0014706C86|nr:zf-HC2 domain-containing protein [Spirillospora albida]